MASLPSPLFRRARVSGVWLAVSLLVFAGCTSDTSAPDDSKAPASASETQPAPDTTADTAAEPLGEATAAIPGLLAERGPFSTLVSALAAAGLDDELSAAGPFTLFAPTDEAFAKLPPDVVAKLLLPENSPTLAKLLKYHVIGGRVPAGSIRESDRDSLEGSKIHFTLADGAPIVNGARIVAGDLPATNGLVHGIDFVLIPPTVDLNALKGSAPTVSSTAPESEGVLLLQTLTEEGNFTTLLSAIEAAGLTKTLSGAGPFTIFAPTDDAFGRLPGETVKKLLLPQNRAALTAILNHHVIAGLVNGRDLRNATDLKMLDGTPVTVKIDQGRISIDRATMTFADQGAGNGVIHIIDAVLTPSGLNLADLAG